VDRLPEKGEITGDEIVLYLILQTKREHQHAISYYFPLHLTFEKDKYDREEIGHALTNFPEAEVLGIFTDKDRAYAHRDTCLYRGLREYTGTINKMTDLDVLDTRPFLVYLDEEITHWPALYRIRKEDYDKLKVVYPSVRLATDEELVDDDPYTTTFIAKDFDEIKAVGLEHITAMRYPEAIPESDQPAVCLHLEKWLSIWTYSKQIVLHHVKDGTNTRDDIVRTLRELPATITDEKIDEMTDSLIAFYGKLIERAAMRERGEEPTEPIYAPQLGVHLKYGDREVSLEYC